MTTRKKNEQGFTLIELLIVIIILGILAAIVVFSVGGITDKGDQSACKADVKTVETAVEAYRAQNSTYPANQAALVPAFVRSWPSSTKYTVTLGAAGAVTVAPACSTL